MCHVVAYLHQRSSYSIVIMYLVDIITEMHLDITILFNFWYLSLVFGIQFTADISMAIFNFITWKL